VLTLRQPDSLHVKGVNVRFENKVWRYNKMCYVYFKGELEVQAFKEQSRTSLAFLKETGNVMINLEEFILYVYTRCRYQRKFSDWPRRDGFALARSAKVRKHVLLSPWLDKTSTSTMFVKRHNKLCIVFFTRSKLKIAFKSKRPQRKTRGR